MIDEKLKTTTGLQADATDASGDNIHFQLKIVCCVDSKLK